MTTMYQCPRCSYSKIPESVSNCPSCNNSLTPANVRAAQKQDEVDALEARLCNASKNCQTRNCEKNLAEFGLAVEKSKAVLCRPFGEVLKILDDENAMYATYYDHVKANMRIPNDNWDKLRTQSDAHLFPNYADEIVFAALSLDNKGPLSYGGVSITLKNETISERASVFEINTTVFIMKHRVAVGDAVPKGYRAPWSQRAKLAMAKLYASITDATVANDHAGILLVQNGSTETDDFVEVNIHRGFNAYSIDTIGFKKQKSGLDKAVSKAMLKKLAERGISHTEW